MYLTGIPRVLDDAKVPYTLMNGWDKYTAHAGGLVAMRAMFWHTTESSNKTFSSGKSCPTLGFCFGRPGKGYPSYNLLGGRDGHVYVLSAGTSAHAGEGSIGGTPAIPTDNGNRYSIGYSMDANNKGYPVTDAQLESAAKVGAAFDREYRGGIRHIMHGEYAMPRGRRSDPTKVPGGWPALRAAIKRGHWNATYTHASTTESEFTMADASRILAEVQATHRRLDESIAPEIRAANGRIDRVAAETRGNFAALEEAIVQLAKGSGLGLDHAKITEAARAGTEKALAEGIDFEVTVARKEG